MEMEARVRLARGTGRANWARAAPARGMLEGDLDEGELEIGQVSGLIDDVPAGGRGHGAAAGRLRRGASRLRR